MTMSGLIVLFVFNFLQQDKMQFGDMYFCLAFRRSKGLLIKYIICNKYTKTSCQRTTEN